MSKTDAQDVLEAVIAEWGGLETFLKEFHDQTTAAPRGSMNKLRVYLSIFAELLKSGGAGDDGRTLAEKQAELRELLEGMSDEDLDED